MVQVTGKCCQVSALEGPCFVVLPVLAPMSNNSSHRHESSFIMATCTIRALITAYIFGFSRSLILLVFAPYVFSGGTLSLGGYFVVLSLAEKLCNTVMVLFNSSLLYGAEMFVAVSRILVKNVMYGPVIPSFPAVL